MDAKPFAPICPRCQAPIYEDDKYLLAYTGYWHRDCYVPVGVNLRPNVPRPVDGEPERLLE